MRVSHIKTAASTNSNLLKGTRGRLLGFFYHNPSSAARFIKFYNKATAPTVGTDVPVLVFGINAAAAGGSLLYVPFPVDAEGLPGISFDQGIGIGVTAAVADNDTTVIAANEILNVFFT